MSDQYTELQRLEVRCRDVGALIGAVLDEHAEQNPDDPWVGFVLWMFTGGPGGWATYLSNADREDVIEALRELLAKLEEHATTPEDQADG